MAVAICFAKGTAILTPDGEVPVESLKIGDMVVTLSGAARPIKWIGISKFDAEDQVHQMDISAPVLIRQDAIADGLPHRDLMVSPLHAIYFADDGAGKPVLIPAYSLLNGSTIMLCRDIPSMDYFHIELTTHDVVFAEGLTAETFLANKQRNEFINVAEYRALYGDDLLAKQAFAPLDWHNKPVPERLAKRAAALKQGRQAAAA